MSDEILLFSRMIWIILFRNLEVTNGFGFQYLICEALRPHVCIFAPALTLAHCADKSDKIKSTKDL